MVHEKTRPPYYFIIKAAIKQEDSDPQFYIPGYVWITHGWYQDKWWTEDIAGKLPNCNDTLLEPLINNTIGIWNSNIQSEISTNVNLVSVNEFKNIYIILLCNRPLQNSSCNIIH